MDRGPLIIRILVSSTWPSFYRQRRATSPHRHCVAPTLNRNSSPKHQHSALLLQHLDWPICTPSRPGVFRIQVFRRPHRRHGLFISNLRASHTRQPPLRFLWKVTDSWGPERQRTKLHCRGMMTGVTLATSSFRTLRQVRFPAMGIHHRRLDRLSPPTLPGQALRIFVSELRTT